MDNTKSLNLVAASSQFMSIADASQTGLEISTGDFTIVGWVKFDTVAAGYQTITCKYDNSNGKREYFLFMNNDESTIDIGWRVMDATTGDNEIKSTNQADLVVDTWYFVYAYVDNTGNTIGVSVNDGTVSTTALTITTHAGTGNFGIGAQNGAANFMNGNIDELGIWTRKLSAAEATEIYNSGNGLLYEDYDAGLLTSLQGYWRFDEDGGGEGLLDETANNNDLTNNNTATFVTDVPFTGSIAYEIIAAVGAFTLTGIAAILTSARNIVAAVGTFTLTGIDVALSRGKMIVAGVGAFTLTGIDATITSARSMVAAVGAFTLTGIDTAFNIGWNMVASVGTFVTSLKSLFIDYWKDEAEVSTSWTDESAVTTTFTDESAVTTTWKDKD